MHRCLEEQQQRESTQLAHTKTGLTFTEASATRLNRGYASFLTSSVSARPTSALFSPASPGAASDTPPPTDSYYPGRTLADPVEKPLAVSAGASTEAFNLATVELEHQKFIEEPVVLAKDLEGVSPLDYWLSKSSHLPLIYKVALDILPAQASSVSSERVFSSSKMTCTPSRNRISAPRVKALQILKHSLGSDPERTLDDEPNVLDFMAQHDDELTGDHLIQAVD
ncbi:hAT family dimerization protein [Ceratobasidium sp. AG-Ba]|nr:hAT family dimerization protein [Ceratobasidium sp. AG-Ba]